MLITLYPQRMKFSFLITTILVLFCIHTRQSNAKTTFSPLERKIIEWTDERSYADSIAFYLTHKDPHIAWRAAWGLANIEDTSIRPKLIQVIAKEERPIPLDGMAFALGVLGQSKQSYQSLLAAAKKYPTNDVFRAIGRTVPKEEVPSLYSSVIKMLESKKVSEETVTILLTELSLRKLMNDSFCGLGAQLASANDPIIRRQAMYSFSRIEDSALLNKHIGTLSEALGDVGSSEVRMFAASALGRIHNDTAGKLLVRAARSEQEWRVMVSLLSAFTRMPKMNTNILDVIRRAVTASSKDQLVSLHVANSALSALNTMVEAGKLSSSDSITVSDWLTSFRNDREQYPMLAIGTRAQSMMLLAHFTKSEDMMNALSSIFSYRDKAASYYATQGLGAVQDTFYFKQLMIKLLHSTENEVVYALEALNTNWQNAKKDSTYMRQLEDEKLANAYRHLLIRLPSQFADPSIVTTALEFVQDSAVIIDSVFFNEASEYIPDYLDRFAGKEFSDHLHSTLQAIRWIRPKHPDLITKLRDIYVKANTLWSDKSLADSARQTLKILGSDVEKPLLVVRKKSEIDWTLLESTPDTMMVQYPRDFIFIELDKQNAPLTCVQMIKLIKANYFVNNTWHRVVPNFVIQAGDPTGTGFGGPGYAIRREVSNRYYDEAGVVGMASSGKDTEGSQWFATHLPTPHLNSRYTIWGKVVQGFDALNTIQRFEKMDNIMPYVP